MIAPSSLPSKVKHGLLIAVALVAAIWAANWIHHRYTHVYIDDARIDGEVVTLSSRVSGWITELPVIEGDEVKKDQVIVQIDSRDARLQREVLLARLQTIETQMAVVRAQGGQVDQETLGKFQSEASQLTAKQAEVASLEVQLSQAQEDYRRAQELTSANWLSPQALERALTVYKRATEQHRKAVAELAAARGALSSAGGSRRQLQVIERQVLVLARQADEIRAEIRRQDIDIADRTILSPSKGLVVMTFVHKGEHVAAGQRLVMFHDPDQIWVQANVKETDLAQLKPGMKADLRVDAFPGQVFQGEVHRIGRAATNKFALLPDPNPSGHFTRITQRLPVRILLKNPERTLRPGMMVEVDIDARNH